MSLGCDFETMLFNQICTILTSHVIHYNNIYYPEIMLTLVNYMESIYKS